MHSFGFTAAWFGAAALLLLAATIVQGIGETRAPGSDDEDAPTSLIHWKAVPPALGFLTSVVAMAGFLAFASLHADAVGVARTSIPLAVYGAVVVACRIAFAKVPDRLPSLQLGAAALAAIATGLTLAAVWTAPTGLLLGAAVLGIPWAFGVAAGVALAGSVWAIALSRAVGTARLPC